MRALAEAQEAAAERAGSLRTLRGLGTAAAGARGRGVLVVSVGNQVGTEGALCPMGDEATGRAGRGGECQRTALPGSARWLHEAEQNFQGQKSLQRGARATGQAGGSVPPADMSGQPSRRG